MVAFFGLWLIGRVVIGLCIVQSGAAMFAKEFGEVFGDGGVSSVWQADLLKTTLLRVDFGFHVDFGKESVEQQ